MSFADTFSSCTTWKIGRSATGISGNARLRIRIGICAIITSLGAMCMTWPFQLTATP